MANYGIPADVYQSAETNMTKLFSVIMGAVLPPFSTIGGANIWTDSQYTLSLISEFYSKDGKRYEITHRVSTSYTIRELQS